MGIEVYFLEIGDILLATHSQDTGYATAVDNMKAEELVSDMKAEELVADRMEQLKGAVQSKEAKIVNKFHKTRSDLQAEIPP